MHTFPLLIRRKIQVSPNFHIKITRRFGATSLLAIAERLQKGGNQLLGNAHSQPAQHSPRGISYRACYYEKCPHPFIAPLPPQTARFLAGPELTPASLAALQETNTICSCMIVEDSSLSMSIIKLA